MRDKDQNKLGDNILFLDILAIIGGFIVSFQIRNSFSERGDVDLLSHLFLIPLLVVILVGSLTYFGAYRSPYFASLTKYTWSVFRAVALSVGILLALLFFLDIKYVSRLVIIIFAVVDFLALLVIRVHATILFKKDVKSGKNQVRLLIIGTRQRAKVVMREFKKQVVNRVSIVGFVDPQPECEGNDPECTPLLGTVENISKILKENVVDEVIIAIPRSLLKDAEPIVIACEEEGITLRFMVDVFNVQVARISLAHVGNAPLLTMEPVAQDEMQLFAKRIFDVCITSLFMPFLLPILILTAIAIKLDSPGPVFFMQQRVGLRKHLFSMYKFRSMYADAEQRLSEIEHLNEADGPIFKMAKDPRVTRVGRIIRKLSIDELPQLFNVLKGEMSLVGPRPMSIRDVELFDRGIQRKRFSVQPGITCIWQISGRSNLSFQRWLELDLEYIENWSLGLDLKILLKTIPAVLKSEGAA